MIEALPPSIGPQGDWHMQHHACAGRMIVVRGCPRLACEGVSAPGPNVLVTNTFHLKEIRIGSPVFQ